MNKEEESIRIVTERKKLLIYIEKLMERPMILLAVIWLVLIILELTRGLNRTLEIFSLVIWVIFILDFLIKFIIAPHKPTFLRKNIITLLSLIIPAIRIARIFVFARLLRTLRLAKLLGSFNRSLKSLNKTMKHRSLGLVIIFTLIVIFAGAAGMYAFEKNELNGIKSYSDAVWWTAMLLITIGSDYWPRSSEGRVLTFLIAFYGFSILGYLTATIASLFIQKESSERVEKRLKNMQQQIENKNNQAKNTPDN